MIISKERGAEYALRIFKSSKGEKGILLRLNTNDDKLNNVKGDNFWYINNTKVAMRTQWVHEGILAYFPIKESDQDFLMEELQTKEEVIFKKDKSKIVLTFTTKGFNENYANSDDFMGSFPID